MKNRFVSLAIIALVAGSGCATEQNIPTRQNVLVRWVFEEGIELLYRTTVSSETEMPGGRGMATGEVVTTQTWSVLNVAANGDATVRIATDRVQGYRRSPVENMGFDSDSDQESKNWKVRMAIVQAGTSYIFVFDSYGQIKDVQGIEELVARMREDLPPDAVAMFDQMILPTFTAEFMKGAFQSRIGSFPTEPVGPGDTWDFTYSLSLPVFGNMTTRITSTLDRIEDHGSRLAIISSTGDSKKTGEADDQFAGMIQIDNVVIIGTTEFDVDRGRVLKSAFSKTMEMTMAVGGQEMAMSTIINTIVELDELVDS